MPVHFSLAKTTASSRKIVLGGFSMQFSVKSLGTALTRDLSSEKLAVKNRRLQFHRGTVCRRISIGSIKYEFK
jgi:hypothetical protein